MPLLLTVQAAGQLLFAIGILLVFLVALLALSQHEDKLRDQKLRKIAEELG
jgi:hypothetical protein